MMFSCHACQSIALPQTPFSRSYTWEATISPPMAAFAYEFEWDPLKAETNLKKHDVTFERASEVSPRPARTHDSRR